MNGELLLIGAGGVALFLLFGVYIAFRSPDTIRSYIGCGVQLYDHQPRGDGTYDATRCITVFYLPFWLLEVLHIRPTGATTQYGGNYAIERHSFDRLGSQRVGLGRAGRLLFRTWVLVPVVAFGPSVVAHRWFGLRSGVPNPPGATAAGAAAALWIAAVFIYLRSRAEAVYSGRR